MHHGRRLAVTAGATVLGLAAMSGVGPPPPAAPRTGPLSDLANTLAGTVDGLTGALTGRTGDTDGSARTAQKAPTTTRPPAERRVAQKPPSSPKKTRPAAGGGKSSQTTKGKPTKKNTARKPAEKPGHLRVGISPDLDLKKLTASGSLSVDTGLNTLLGPAGLRLETDGRLSAEDIAIGDPEAEGDIKLTTRLGDAGLGIATGGKAVVKPSEVSATGSLNVCGGAGCLDAPTPPNPPGPPGTPPVPPGTPPGAPSPSPGLPDLPPSSPLLPDLPQPGEGPAVTAASVGSPPAGDLPYTGADSISLAALGIAAMTAGGVAVAATRRRTPKEG